MNENTPEATINPEAGASLDDYKRLMDERPVKFAPEAAHFGKDLKYPCISCMHFYIGMVMSHNVCEVVRTIDENIEWFNSCQFHTIDGESFPKLKSDK